MQICPICSKSTVKEFKPFCSKRCKEVDLGQWLNGFYTIPSIEPINEEIQKNNADDN